MLVKLVKLLCFSCFFIKFGRKLSRYAPSLLRFAQSVSRYAPSLLRFAQSVSRYAPVRGFAPNPTGLRPVSRLVATLLKSVLFATLTTDDFSRFAPSWGYAPSGLSPERASPGPPDPSLATLALPLRGYGATPLVCTALLASLEGFFWSSLRSSTTPFLGLSTSFFGLKARNGVGFS